MKDGEMDSVQCSRLLVHIPDISKVINEMVRVVRTGGCGDFSEGNFYSHVVYTSDEDERLRSIASSKNQHTISQCANPGAAMDAYKLLVARSDVENVKV
jgi:ubiquinone/menaquinone biosynthesis C-methylase UbiE